LGGWPPGGHGGRIGWLIWGEAEEEEEEGGAELLVLAGPEEELVVAPVMDMLLSTRDSRSQRTEVGMGY